MKFNRARATAVTAALTLNLLLGVGAVMVHARKQPGDLQAAESAFGMVDLEKVYEASDAPGKLAQSAAEIETDAQSRVDAMIAVSHLSEAELKEFGDLAGVKNPDAKQKVRMEELKDFSDKRGEHLREVQQKPEAQLTPEDRKLMSAATQQKRLFDKMIQILQADIRQQVAERIDLVKRGLIAGLRVEIAKVAREKKIDHVFDVNAMVTSTNDITPAVLQRIGKHGGKQ